LVVFESTNEFGVILSETWKKKSLIKANEAAGSC